MFLCHVPIFKLIESTLSSAFVFTNLMCQKKKNELGVRTKPYEQKRSNNATCLCNPHVYMRGRDILIRIPPSYRHIVFIINEDIQLMRILWAFIKTILVFAPQRASSSSDRSYKCRFGGILEM